MNTRVLPPFRALRAACHVSGITAFLCGFAMNLHAATLPAGFNETRLATGLSNPTSMTIAPDGRIFVCEKAGRIRVIKNGTLLSTPFLTLTPDTTGERGLLSVAFHTNFATNRWVYVFYTATSPSVHNRISRFTANGDVVVAGSEKVIIDLPGVSSTINNGGDLSFNNGTLFISTGDHGTSSNAQSFTSRFGKMLRVNPDGSIPDDNPFLSQTTGAFRSIWARGLRNPIRFDIAGSPWTPEIFINDVKSNASRQEINVGTAGANYGWGTSSTSGMTPPIHSYPSSTTTMAISGGALYRPTNANFGSDWIGRYFFADSGAGWIKWISVSNPSTSTTFATGISQPADLEVDVNGALYYLARGTGSVFRITKGTGCAIAPLITSQPVTKVVPRGATGTVSVRATSSSSCPTTYRWEQDLGVDDGWQPIDGATSPDFTFVSGETFMSNNLRVVVSNGAGSTISDEFGIIEDPCPEPWISIFTPSHDGGTPETRWKPGDTVKFFGKVTDPIEGLIPATSFKWRVDLVHQNGVRQSVLTLSGVSSGSFKIPDNINETESPNYEISLTATTTCGHTATAVDPLSAMDSQVFFGATPNWVQMTVDGVPEFAGFTLFARPGSLHTLGTTSPQSQGGQNWFFQQWNDGGAQTHTARIPLETFSSFGVFFTNQVGPIVREAESLPRSSTGAPTALQNDPNTSGGVWVALQADSVSDVVTYTIAAVPTGVYRVKMKYKAHPSRGILQLSTFGSPIGSPLDQYSASAAYLERTFGTISLPGPGDVQFELTVTGKNAASNAFTLSADQFILEPVTP